MERARKQAMNRGVVLFAFNSEKYDYFKMAVATAKRVHHFLGLPVTLITDKDSLQETQNIFDKIHIVEPDKNNRRDWGQWINKGRYQAYELSPYDDTILLDTDYMINSNKLLTLFEFDTDFCCHSRTEFFMQPKLPQERLSAYSYDTLWATVVRFKKSTYSKQIFECLEMVQKNYMHYSMLHGFNPGVYRNDYALSIAVRIVNGQFLPKSNIIPWSLYHVGKNTSIYRNNDSEFNTEYTVMFDNWQRGKIRKEYMYIDNMDFHVMIKENFMELIA